VIDTREPLQVCVEQALKALAPVGKSANSTMKDPKLH
jgi:hypothetical protein